MIVLKGLEAARAAQLPKPVVTAGTFDGVHQGHKTILRQLVETAKDIEGTPVVITYEPHPRQVLPHRAGDDVRILTTLEEKLVLLEQEGVAAVLVIPFTLEFSQWTSQQYIKDVMQDALQVHTLVIGYDHRFGRNREGSFQYLQAHAAELGFAVREIPRHDVDAVGVSSTRTRHALMDGDLHIANRYLGRPYALTGTVVKGDQIGRTLGFPTANMAINHKDKLIPAHGVYGCRVTLANGKRYIGAMNIGYRPAVGGRTLQVETYILDFDGSLYDQDITVELYYYLRNEWNFPNLEALTEQINKDVMQVRQLMRHADAEGR